MSDILDDVDEFIDDPAPEEVVLAEPDTFEDEVAEEPEAKPVVDKEEELALKNGWKPKDQYEGNQADWRTAKQFNDHARMIAKIKSQDRDLENLKKYMQLNQKQAQQTALDQARQELEDAKELGDFDAYEEARQKHTQAEQGAAELQAVDNQEIERMFLDRNKDWLDPQDNAQMKEVYDVAKQVTEDYPNTTVLKAMELVERRIMDEHPEYRRKNTSLDRQVVSGTNSAVNKGAVATANSSKSFSSLSVTLQREYESLRRSLEKTMKISYTKEEYVQGLKDQGAI